MDFYSHLMNTPEMGVALLNSSVSKDDARNRGEQYAKMFSRNEELLDNIGMSRGSLLQKTFSGYAETPLMSTQYFNASVASYVSSFAGFMSVERDFEQPNGLFYWFDVLGVTDYRAVIPNLGPDNYQDVQMMGRFETELTITGTNGSEQKDFSFTSGRIIIPGTVRIKITKDSQKTELVDNGQGTFMSVAGVLDGTEAPTINYMNGKIEFKLAEEWKLDKEKASVVIVGKEDTTGAPSCHKDATGSNANSKRFLAKQQQIGLRTVPDMLVAEYNIAALGAMKKATGSDMATFLFTKLRELYTKTINYNLVSLLEKGYTGNVMNELDLSNDSSQLASKFTDYRSRVDLFDAYLINVEAALATKAVKGVTTTAYVAGNMACNQFQKGGVIGKFKKNTKMSYINDLIGWYDEIPVLRSTDIAEKSGEGTFYAIHKTKDGQMAPLARGIYMPLTDTPTVGNYNNPTQMASGIYYQEGITYMAPELVQKVTFKMGL